MLNHVQSGHQRRCCRFPERIVGFSIKWEKDPMYVLTSSNPSSRPTCTHKGGSNIGLDKGCSTMIWTCLTLEIALTQVAFNATKNCKQMPKGSWDQYGSARDSQGFKRCQKGKHGKSNEINTRRSEQMWGSTRTGYRMNVEKCRTMLKFHNAQHNTEHQNTSQHITTYHNTIKHNTTHDWTRPKLQSFLL